jgi:hypothetical protein
VNVYISGPITGKKDNNRQAFEKATETILAMGNSSRPVGVVDPCVLAQNLRIHFHCIGIETEPMWEDYMREDIKCLMDCTYVFQLPGWEKSKGATIEHFIARTLGIPCFKTYRGLEKAIGGVYDDN